MKPITSGFLVNLEQTGKVSKMGLSGATLSRINQFSCHGLVLEKVSLNTEKAYRNHIKHFEEHLHTKGKTICNTTGEDIDEYIAELQKSYSLNTTATRIAAVKSYFGWLRREKHIIYVPTIKSIRHTKVQRTDATEEEIAELLKQIPPTRLRYTRDAAMISLMAYQGFSTQEIVDMNVDDVDLHDNIIQRRETWCPMKKACGHILKYAQAKQNLGLSQKDDDPFFLNKVGQRITSRSLRRHFNIYLEKTNLKGRFTTRDLYLSRSKKIRRIPQLVTG